MKRILTLLTCLFVLSSNVVMGQSAGDTWFCNKKDYIYVDFEEDYSSRNKDFVYKQKYIEWRSSTTFFLGLKSKYDTFKKVSDDGWYISEGSENFKSTIYIAKHKNTYRVVEYEPATYGGFLGASRLHVYDCMPQ